MEKPFPAYDGDEPYVFVCYAHADAEVVYPEIAWLQANGVNIWYDEGISPGREFPEALGEAILGARQLLFYVSGASVASRHCRDEVYLALDRDVPVVASHLEPTEMPPGLALSTGTTQAVMRWEMSEKVYQDKLQAALSDEHSVVQGQSKPEPAGRRRSGRGMRAALGVGLVSVVLLGGVAVQDWRERQADIRWARSQLPVVQEMIESTWRDFIDAYSLALRLQPHLPDDPALAAVIDEASVVIDINSQPAGAEVYMKPYRTPDAPWTHLGSTPIEGERVAIGVFRWRFEKPGYQTVVAAESTWDLYMGPAGSNLIVANNFTRTLDPLGSLPDGMVRVPGRATPQGEYHDFFIDRREITNAQFKAFVDAGGYTNPDYWQHEFTRDGQPLDWDGAMALLVDQTGRPGPATWQAGTYPDGGADYPVNGVTWYEAAAYAAFVGRSLPTGTHWGLARGEYTPLIQWPQLGGYALFAPFSNFDGDAPVKTGSLDGIMPSGAVDMAGNVREWCLNVTSLGRLVRGGSFGDPTYRFTELSQSDPFERSPVLGFRTVLLDDAAADPAAAFATMAFEKNVDYYSLTPVADDVFEVFRAQFEYDSAPLHPILESSHETRYWERERIGIDAAYGDERLVVHLFLPESASPPYRTVVYFPGSAVLFMPSSDELDSYYEVSAFLSFLMKNGYAVAFPVYKGSFERGGAGLAAMHEGEDSHDYSEWLRHLTKDVRRTIDYLETREDIDTDSLAYYGLSWGALVSPIIAAVEPRLKSFMLIGGGFVGEQRPESAPINYVGRVSAPLLMMHGRYDTLMPYPTSAKPLFDLFGTADSDKVMRIYDTDHIPPTNEFVKEMLAWLEQHQPPVIR